MQATLWLSKYDMKIRQSNTQNCKSRHVNSAKHKIQKIIFPVGPLHLYKHIKHWTPLNEWMNE